MFSGLRAPTYPAYMHLMMLCGLKSIHHKSQASWKDKTMLAMVIRQSWLSCAESSYFSNVTRFEMRTSRTSSSLASKADSLQTSHDSTLGVKICKITMRPLEHTCACENTLRTIKHTLAGTMYVQHCTAVCGVVHYIVLRGDAQQFTRSCQYIAQCNARQRVISYFTIQCLAFQCICGIFWLHKTEPMIKILLTTGMRNPIFQCEYSTWIHLLEALKTHPKDD